MRAPSAIGGRAACRRSIRCRRYGRSPRGNRRFRACVRRPSTPPEPVRVRQKAPHRIPPCSSASCGSRRRTRSDCPRAIRSATVGCCRRRRGRSPTAYRPAAPASPRRCRPARPPRGCRPRGGVLPCAYPCVWPSGSPRFRAWRPAGWPPRTRRSTNIRRPAGSPCRAGCRASGCRG